MTLCPGHLRLASYNCKGWSNGKSAVSDLLDSHDICVIQEHWLFTEHLMELNFNPDFRMVGVSGMDSSTLLYGRPYEGCAILFRKSLSDSITVFCTNANRFCAVRLCDNRGHSVLLICVYLPTDYNNRSSRDEFLFVLAELEGFIQAQQFDSLLIVGDFNVDLDRDRFNTEQLVSFIGEFNLVSVDYCFRSRVVYTFEGPNGSKSWLDHIISSRPLDGCFTSVQKLDLSSDFSDHFPLSGVFDFHPRNGVLLPPQPTPHLTSRTAWHKVSDLDLQQYCHVISDLLPAFPSDLLACSDPACTQHFSDLDSLSATLFHCISEASHLTLPHVTSFSRSQRVPGWNDAARHLKSKADFWHRVWCEAGSPAAGVLVQLKKASKRRFKYEVRRLKRQRSHIRRRRMAEALAKSDSRNFWKEVKNINRSSTSASCSPVVDGVRGDAEISSAFANKLCGVLSSDDSCARDSLFDLLDNDMSVEELTAVSVGASCVHSAFQRLKLHKHDGTNLLSDHLICASPAIDQFVADLFSSILRHGYMPSSLRDCILVPIPKGNKDPTSSDNYRPIALAPTLSKALEWCILISFPSYFSSSDLQFGFKKHFSTTLCTGLVKNVVSRFVFNGSPVFGCFLDASKAFDKVNHAALFNKLLARDLPPVLCRFLLSWYKDQKMQVCWNTSVSSAFSVTNGVRQGGVLSPILFTIYLDDLLSNLKSLGVGCYWDNCFVGAVAYADDVALLAPSASALRLMLQCCEDFALSWGLTFNASKTQLIRFGSLSPRSCTTTIKFSGTTLQFVEDVIHLGHYLSFDLSDSVDILSKSRDLIKKANLMLYTFSVADPLVKTRLLQCYCLSLFGCALWNLSCPALSTIEVSFNNILRRIWQLPRNSHTGILHLTARLPSIVNVVLSRSSALLFKARSSPSSIVRLVFQASSTLSYTSVGYNAFFGSQHAKTYFPQDGLCASVIRHVRGTLGYSIDSDTNDMLITISSS